MSESTSPTGHPVERKESISASESDVKEPIQEKTGLETVELDGQNLGTAQLVVDNHIVLHPCPSADPNDPLNWSPGFKAYFLFVMCFLSFMGNWAASGPAVAIVPQALEFTGRPPNIAKVADFSTCQALTTGIGNFIWIPIANKYGRRFPILFATAGYLFTLGWCAISHNYHSQLAGRIVMGLVSGGLEGMAPLTVCDVFFLHERGTALTWTSLSLVSGSSLSIIIMGLIYLKSTWRTFFWMSFGMVALFGLLFFFTIPETAFRRTRPSQDKVFEEAKAAADASIPKKTWAQNLSIFSGTYTEESLFKMFIRPLGLLFVPPVTVSIIIYGFALGFYVSMSVVYTTSFSKAPYHFGTTHCALLHIANFVSALIAVPLCAWATDVVVNRMTRKNNGVFQPEFRLVIMVPAAFIGPLGLIIWGLSFTHGWHWFVPTFASAMLSFAMVPATQAALVYPVDVYKPIAGEVITAIVGWKSVYTFGVSYANTEWIQSQGTLKAFGEMAAIFGAGLLLFVPLYIWGSRIRHATLQWRLLKWLMWNADRDDVAVAVAH